MNRYLEKVNIVLRFLKSFINWAKVGFKRTKFSKQRMAICESCPKMKENKICGVCGCFLPIKTLWVTESCPEDKW